MKAAELNLTKTHFFIASKLFFQVASQQALRSFWPESADITLSTPKINERVDAFAAENPMKNQACYFATCEPSR